MVFLGEMLSTQCKFVLSLVYIVSLHVSLACYYQVWHDEIIKPFLITPTHHNLSPCSRDEQMILKTYQQFLLKFLTACAISLKRELC